MLRLDEETGARVNALIERYGLHDPCAVLPVPIRQVAKDEGWHVCFHGRMGGMIAMAVIDGPVKLMYVNANLTYAAQAEGIAHELGHALAGHHASLDLYMAHGHKRHGIRRQTDEQEVEATIIACLLLVPEHLRSSPFTNREVADLCHVGTRLVAFTRALEPLVEVEARHSYSIAAG